MRKWKLLDLMYRGRQANAAFVATILRDQMSALGQKQTSGHVRSMSALPPKADIGTQPRDVRYVPKADILRCGKERRYSATSSASASSFAGIARSSAFAVLRLIKSSNLVDCTTGRSVGLSPLRIRPV